MPNKLSVKDVDLTSILSNAMENAINAASSQKTGERVISLSMLQRNGKLLISVENSYDIAPKFKDDMPIAEADDHGFGTQSIYYTAEKLHGNCRFSISGGKFILQVVI
ncbi:MAG: GHKL domain-containing protein [Anaerovoracaceae bacterium]|nr:GHKL domain-containing protein [Anaerovoracaceae bacterium]